MTLLETGDEVVSSSHLYGGSLIQLTYVLKKMGVTVRYVDPTVLDQWEAAITPNTRALYGETIGNPKGSVMDIEAIAVVAG